MEDIEKGDVDIENPLSKIYSDAHPNLMKEYSER
jgi:hypothetical protein